MALTVSCLGPGDEEILSLLASDAADFDLSGQEALQQPLAPDVSRRYLANPAVLHWVALLDDAVVGSLYCILLPLGSGAGSELLLYEIGVRTGWRRQGIGRVLVAEMEQWMRENDVTEVWLLADNPAAVDFYRACGFAADESQPVYLTRSLHQQNT